MSDPQPCIVCDKECERGDLPADLVSKLVDDACKWVRCAIAARADLPADLIAALAADADWAVRCAVSNRA